MKALLVALLAAFPLAGCFGPHCANAGHPFEDCAYGAGPVSATTYYAHEAWNASLVRGALSGMGFVPQASAFTVVAGTQGPVAMRAYHREDGTIQLDLEFGGGSASGLTEAEARSVLSQREADARPRAAQLLAQFDNATGWRHDQELVWTSAMSVV